MKFLLPFFLAFLVVGCHRDDPGFSSPIAKRAVSQDEGASNACSGAVETLFSVDSRKVSTEIISVRSDGDKSVVAFRWNAEETDVPPIPPRDDFMTPQAREAFGKPFIGNIKVRNSGNGECDAERMGDNFLVTRIAHDEPNSSKQD